MRRKRASQDVFSIARLVPCLPQSAGTGARLLPNRLVPLGGPYQILAHAARLAVVQDRGKKPNMRGIRLVAAVSCSLGLLACEDSTVPAAPGGDGDWFPPPVIEGDGGTAGVGPGGQGGLGGRGGTAGTPRRGACDDREDEAALASLTNPPTENARGISATCAVVSCSDELGQGQANFLECMTTRCLDTRLPGVSPACTSCYAALGWCAQLLCNTFCANTPCSDSCLDCAGGGADYQRCLAALDLCTGRPSVDCD